jgi:hypothetical protein
MGSYDPNSPLDQRKAQAIDAAWQRNGGRMSPNQMYQDPGYMGINKSGSHDGIEKSAWLQSLMRGGQKFSRSNALGAMERGLDEARTAAKSLTGKGSGKQRSMLKNLTPGEFGKIQGIGQTRMGMSDRLGRMGDWLNDNQGIARGLNIGLPTVGIGAGLYGANRMGHSSGMEQGLSQGFDTGADYGIQASLANMPQDPGFLGRIADVFTGQQRGPQAYDIQSLLDTNKSQILQQLRSA